MPKHNLTVTYSKGICVGNCSCGVSLGKHASDTDARDEHKLHVSEAKK